MYYISIKMSGKREKEKREETSENMGYKWPLFLLQVTTGVLGELMCQIHTY